MRIMIQGHMNLAQAYCGMWNDLGNMENQHTTQNKDNKTWASKKRIRMGMFLYSYLVVVQSLSRVWLFVTPWTAAHQASLPLTNFWSLLKLMSIMLVMPSNHLILCRPLLLLPSIFPSIRIFSNDSVLCIRWPKYWSFSFSNSPSDEYSGLISFRVDWFDLLACIREPIILLFL